MVAAGIQAPRLSAPTLLEGSPPGFSSTAKAFLLSKKFCLKPDTVLKKSRHNYCRECQGNASSLQLPAQSLPHDWFGATATKLEGLPKHSAPIYVWILENGVNINTTTLTLFPENTREFSFNQPQTVC